MPLVSVPEPFDHPDWLYEMKHDGCRALAIVEGHECRLVSRRGHAFAKWDPFGEEITHSVRCRDAVLDGELVCLDADGRSNFYRLLFDLEGVVAKWSRGTYQHDGIQTSWVKVKNRGVVDHGRECEP
ncbi:MAG TPA: hypothetical protein VKE96_22555 [Vicinamibacterales bacterium]|nr:hypothetical protein [Vicinamibacterales bacterium]